MANASWLTFCVSSQVTKTFVHFFPSAGGIGAPYQVSCTLTLFGNDLGKRTIKIDGLKITQPDGVRIDDVFPHFEKSETNIAGLKIELNTNQPRIDLSSSWCLVELVTQSGSTRFKAKSLSDSLDGAENVSSGALISDDKFSSSLIAINADREVFNPSLKTIDNTGQLESLKAQRKDIAVPSLAPMSVEEISVNGDFFTENTSAETSWGKSNIGGVYVNPSLDQETAVFAVYRETNNKRPVSVLAL